MAETGKDLKQVIVKVPAVLCGQVINHRTGEIKTIVQFEKQQAVSDYQDEKSICDRKCSFRSG